ncbi:hypothetical protein R1flu_022238 [Riccia fluitans]|uniref:Uncharacterized protein n=1 Tax=Riccia fluitans TaxID=41844 RepID=A0ABD1ZSP6_9MARC
MSRLSRTLQLDWEGRQGWHGARRPMKEKEEGVMWKWKGSSKPLGKSIFESQLGGKPCRTVKQLPLAVYERLPRAMRTIAALYVDLDTAVATEDLYNCGKVVETLTRQLRMVGGISLEASREAFVACGGNALLLQVLFCPFETQRASAGGVAKIAKLQKECLDILRELCYTVPFFADSLAANPEYLIKCFSQMANQGAFSSAILLAEEILAVRDEILDLREVPDFIQLVQHFTPRQLVSFCRILAMVVFEAEPMKVVPGEEAMSKIEAVASVVEINHEVILSIPNVLSRLVKLLNFYKLPHTHQIRSRSSSALASASVELVQVVEVDHVDALAMALQNSGRLFRSFEVNEAGTVIHGYIADESADVDITSEDLTSLTAVPPSDITTALTALTAVPAPDIVTRLNALSAAVTAAPDLDMDANSIPGPEIFNLQNQVEILFVLCALCGSKRRDQVQDALAQLGLVDILDHMFDKLDWTTSHSLPKPGGIHGHGCECNPRSALKIQYLSLIHNFCDRDSCNQANKHLLFKPSFPVVKEKLFSGKHLGSSEGLMMKVVKVLIQEPADSIYRFWLASCVEAFLRGADVSDQEIVASTGLMEHLLAEILKGGFSCASSLQINFDLLGELLKFNRVLFSRFSSLFTGDKLGRFVEALITNLVDSNVFIRSVLLSLERFESQRHEVDFFSPPIATFILQNEFRLLQDLMSAVPLGDVNQDNICVLNTALIMFILAERNGRFDSYIQVLRRADADGAGTLLQKFRQLLTFWKRYYLRKPGRDSLTLQYSTNIPFEDWLKIVNLLCKEPEGLSSTSGRIGAPHDSSCSSSKRSSSSESTSRRC